MKCPKCGEEFPSNTPMCPRCGAFLSDNQSPKTSADVRLKIVYTVAGVLLAVILIALLVKSVMSGRSITQSESPSPSPGPVVTNAPPPSTAAGPSVTNAPVPVQPPPPRPVQAPAKPAAPQDVIDYLKSVQKIEAYRQALLQDTARALAMATGVGAINAMLGWIDESQAERADPYADLKNEVGRQITQWQNLVRNFDGIPLPRPPGPGGDPLGAYRACAEFAGAYRAGLTGEINAMYRIVHVVAGINVNSTQSMQDAVTQLQRMKSDPNTQGNIDKAIERADYALSDLSSRIGIEKPFEVKKESQTGGSIIGGL
ncbi:MAG: zinc ribbon domain-containing protein [Armatimonadetes bacterium]|nr:zinc ribbon domain-containing protein [Armatimonadota bacterium]